jgi:O-methyltransferase involved in polyketide biosynthesis
MDGDHDGLGITATMEIVGKIQLTDEQETLFIPLYGKALDYRAKHSLLNDRTANDIVEKLGADLEKHRRFGSRGLAVRVKQYDAWTTGFLAEHGNAVVVHLGCGLDARVKRTRPSSRTTWFDVDYPDVISLRRKFFQETDECRMIASSITATGWLEGIPSDRPALILAEGVFEYLTEQEVRTLINRLLDHFPHGQMAFDVMDPSARDQGNRRLRKKTGAVSIVKWAVDDLSEVDGLNSRLARIETVPLFDSAFVKELPLGLRSMLSILRLFPKRRNGMRLLRYEF